VLDRHLRETPLGRADARQVLDELAPFTELGSDGETALERLQALLVDQYSGGEQSFKLSDFVLSRDHLAFLSRRHQLIGEFGRALSRRWAWPRLRAEMARRQLQHCLAQNNDRLLPAGDALEAYLGGQLQGLQVPAHRLWALAQALPLWVSYLVERGLCLDRQAAPLYEPLGQIAARLRAELELSVHDPEVFPPIITSPFGAPAHSSEEV
jgi:hypothetical protein